MQAEEENLPVTVHILGKEYRIGCKEGERNSLLASAQLVDQRMREIRQSGRVLGSDRIAVLAALNIAHDLLEAQKIQGLDHDVIGERLHNLQKKIERALESDRVV